MSDTKNIHQRLHAVMKEVAYLRKEKKVDPQSQKKEGQARWIFGQVEKGDPAGTGGGVKITRRPADKPDDWKEHERAGPGQKGQTKGSLGVADHPSAEGHPEKRNTQPGNHRILNQSGVCLARNTVAAISNGVGLSPPERAPQPPPGRRGLHLPPVFS